MPGAAITTLEVTTCTSFNKGNNNGYNKGYNKGGNKGKKEVQVFQLEQHCKNLEEQLDDVSNFSNW